MSDSWWQRIVQSIQGTTLLDDLRRMDEDLVAVLLARCGGDESRVEHNVQYLVDAHLRCAEFEPELAEGARRQASLRMTWQFFKKVTDGTEWRCPEQTMSGPGQTMFGRFP